MKKGDTQYKARYNVTNDTTEIVILYKGARVMSLEFYGQLQPPAVKEYASEAVELLIQKGVIESDVDRQ